MKMETLQSLFLDNSALFQQAGQFCDSLPEYVRARQEYERLAREVHQVMGRRYLDYEAALNRCWAAEDRAYYLFGLGLRRELLDSLGAGLV